MLLEARFHLDILTKSELVLRDLDVFHLYLSGVYVDVGNDGDAPLIRPEYCTVYSLKCDYLRPQTNRSKMGHFHRWAIHVRSSVTTKVLFSGSFA